MVGFLFRMRSIRKSSLYDRVDLLIFIYLTGVLKDSIQDSFHRLVPLFSYKVSFQHCIMKLISIHTSCVTCYVQSSKLWLTHNKSPNRESHQLFETKIKYKLLSGRIYIFIVLHSLKRRLMIKANTGFGPHNLTISCTNFLTLSAPWHMAFLRYKFHWEISPTTNTSI